MFEHLRWPHGIESLQYLECAEVNRFGTLKVTAEWQGFILSLLSIEEKYESSYVVYPPEEQTNFEDILLYQDAVVKFAVEKAIS